MENTVFAAVSSSRQTHSLVQNSKCHVTSTTMTFSLLFCEMFTVRVQSENNYEKTKKRNNLWLLLKPL